MRQRVPQGEVCWSLNINGHITINASIHENTVILVYATGKTKYESVKMWMNKGELFHISLFKESLMKE